MASPKTRQTLGLYLATSDIAVSSIIFVGETEKPEYFLGKKYTGGGANYPKLDQMPLALVYSTQRLPQYFQRRMIKVYTEYTLKKILRRTHQSRRIAKWNSILSAYCIEFESRKSEKVHAIAPLLSDFPVQDPSCHRRDDVDTEDDAALAIQCVTITGESSSNSPHN